MAEALRLVARPAGAGILSAGRHGRASGAAGLLVQEVAGFGLATLQARQGQAAELSARIAPDAHAVLVLDQAGWHGARALVVPHTITLVAAAALLA